jgi:hypothetical protein
MHPVDVCGQRGCDTTGMRRAPCKGAPHNCCACGRCAGEGFDTVNDDAAMDADVRLDRARPFPTLRGSGRICRVPDISICKVP